MQLAMVPVWAGGAGAASDVLCKPRCPGARFGGSVSGALFKMGWFGACFGGPVLKGSMDPRGPADRHTEPGCPRPERAIASQ